MLLAKIIGALVVGLMLFSCFREQGTNKGSEQRPF